MACVILTPQLRDIASLLEISNERACILGGLFANRYGHLNFTADSLRTILNEENSSGIDEFTPMNSIEIAFNPKLPIINYLPGGNIGINLSTENPVSQVLSYILATKGSSIANQQGYDFKDLIRSYDTAKLFMLYYELAREMYNSLVIDPSSDFITVDKVSYHRDTNGNWYRYTRVNGTSPKINATEDRHFSWDTVVSEEGTLIVLEKNIYDTWEPIDPSNENLIEKLNKNWAIDRERLGKRARLTGKDIYKYGTPEEKENLEARALMDAYDRLEGYLSSSNQENLNLMDGINYPPYVKFGEDSFPLNYGKVISVNKETGARREVGALIQYGSKSIAINLPYLKQAYEKLAWKNPKRSAPISEDIEFSSLQDFVLFCVFHEYSHYSLVRQGKDESDFDYETRMNMNAEAIYRQYKGIQSPTTQQTMAQQTQEVPQTGTESIRKIKGFSRQEVQEQVSQEQAVAPFVETTPAAPLKMPQVSRKNFSIDRRDTPFKRLTRTFSSLERKEAADALASDFTDTLTAMIREKRLKLQSQLANTSNIEEQNALQNTIKSLTDPDEKTRRKAMGIITTEAIVNRMKEQYRNYIDSPEVRSRDLQRFGENFVTNKVAWLSKILDNFEELMNDASIQIESIESVKIDFVHKSLEESKVENPIDNGSEENSDENSSLEKDGWMIKQREVDPRLSLSQRVKKVISRIPKGSEKNFLGKPKLLNPDYVHAVLINELSNMKSANDFITIDGTRKIVSMPALEALAKKYNWVNVLINTLKKDPVLASAFYTDFRKDFISYTTVMNVTEEENRVNETTGEKYTVDVTKRVTKYLNKSVALDATLSEVISNYDQSNILDDDSIYEVGKVNERNREKNLNSLNKILAVANDADFDWADQEDVKDKVLEPMLKILHSIGFNSQMNSLESLLSMPNGIQLLSQIASNMSVILGSRIPEGNHLIDYFNSAYTAIASIVGEVSELMNVQSFRASDKMFYSYSAPNYVTAMIKNLTNIDDSARNEYIQEQFGKYEWFFDHSKNQWRNGWLDLLTGPNGADVRAHFKIEDMNTIRDTNRRGEEETVSYENWTQEQMAEAFILQYYSIPESEKSLIQYAKYNVPIFSDSPVVSFITMPKVIGPEYKNIILSKLVDVAKQELWRIAEVDRRAADPSIAKIANFDRTEESVGGAKFFFLPQLNDEGLYNELNKMMKEGNMDAVEDTLYQVIYSIMEEEAARFEATNPISAQVLIDQGIITSEDGLQDALDNYFWNQAYATSQIIQLTTTDLAFYKDDVDFQKRFKEVYAAGNKLNPNSEYGRETERTIYLSDVKIPSPSLNDIADILDAAVSEGRISLFDKDAILTKFKKVNVADAQAYRSISSMRAILDMMGQWTPKMEEAVNKFNDGTWTTEDYSIIWQTVKPFMFTQVSKDSVSGPIKVPHQNKNSEFLLLAMHNLIAASNIGKSPVLKAINRYMEDNNIDVIQFESAVKAGGQGVVSLEGLTTEKEVYDTLSNTAGSKGVYNPNIVHEFKYEDYVVQQPTPEHLIDTEPVIYGSQFRNLVVSDISEGAEFNLNGYTYSKPEILKLYQSAIVENLLEDFNRLRGKFNTIDDVQKALLDTIKGNPKYGREMFDALQIVERNGKRRFNIPLYNPSTTVKLQEIINSFFKSAITKQHIKGGNCILVSAFGLTDELKMVYGTDARGKKYLVGAECYLPAYSKQFYEPFMKKDANGNEYLDIGEMPDELKQAVGYRIPTEDKYSMVPLIIKGFLPQANGSAIMVPADITVHAGSDFDVDKMFLMLPEFKVSNYKMQEAKAAYATEMEANKRDKAAVALIQKLLGKDVNDEGALNIPGTQSFRSWLKNHPEYKRDKPKVYKVSMGKDRLSPESIQSASREQRNNLLIDIARSVLTNSDTVDKFVNPGSFDKAKRAARIARISKDPSKLQKVAKALEGKKSRAATLVKIEDARGLSATSPEVINALLNPRILSLKELNALAKDEGKNPLSPLTFFYNHKQNMTGGALIGWYANNTTLFSKFQSYNQKEVKMNTTFSFKLNGVTFNRLDGITSPHGERISKNCAEFSAASVDNVKDPVLADLLQDTNTANITALMLRWGMSIEEIGLLFTQPIVREYLNVMEDEDDVSEFVNRIVGPTELMNWYSSIGSEKALHRGEFSDNYTADILNADWTSSELLALNIVGNQFGGINGIVAAFSSENDLDTRNKMQSYIKHQVRILELFRLIKKTSDQLGKLTKIARADSPNGAMAISIAGNMIQRQRVKNLKEQSNRLIHPDWFINGVNIYDTRATFDKKTEDLRRIFMSSRFPMLQAFYSLGIDFGHSLTQEYFPVQYNSDVIETIDYLTAMAKNDTLTEKQLNTFFKELTQYQLSGISLFQGDDFNKQRDFYLSQYPSRFMSIKAKHPELASLGILKKITINKRGDLEFERSGRLTPSMREAFIKDFDSLLYMDSLLAQQVAMDLFVYSYYKDGLYYGPNSFGTFFSPNFITSIPEYINGLDNISTTDTKSNFLGQFLLNNIRSGILPTLPYNKKDDKEKKVLNKRIDENTGEVIVTMNGKAVYNRELQVANPYYVGKEIDKINNHTYWFLYERIGDGTSDTVDYRQIAAPQLWKSKRYNKKASAIDISKYRVDAIEEKVMAQTSTENEVDYIQDVDEKPTYEVNPAPEIEKYSVDTNINKTELLC